MSNFVMCHRLSPSVSTDSSNIECESEDKHPQSGWSDSDHSDSQSKSWVARGSKMLKKKNSKFALGLSKAAEWVEEHGQAPGDQSSRGYNKHGRMLSTGNGRLYASARMLTLVNGSRPSRPAADFPTL